MASYSKAAQRALSSATRAPLSPSTSLAISSSLRPLRSYSTPPPPRPTPSTSRPVPKTTPTGLPGANLPGAGKYSPLTVSVVTTLAKVFGYNSQTSTAIRTASDYYDRCAERGELEAPFFYEECSLPPSFQTWFSITTLHIWLLSVRFRSLPAPLGRTYIQELINHFFIDIELRIRGPYNISQGKLIKGYMRDMLEQYHGSVAAYDEGLMGGDAVLAAAIWRNIFGGGWSAVGGIKGKRAPKAGEVPKLGPNPNPMAIDPVQFKAMKKGAKGQDVFKTDEPVVDPLRAAAELKAMALYPEDPDIEFVQSLERMVQYVRREVQRLEQLPEENVLSGRLEKGTGSLIEFTKI